MPSSKSRARKMSKEKAAIKEASNPPADEQQEDEEEEEQPGLKLLSEHFEHDAELATVKYMCKYLLTKGDKVFESSLRKMIDIGVVMMPLCLLGCLKKMIEHGQQNGLDVDGIGIIFCSDKIPFGGKVCEPIKRDNLNLDELAERILDKLANMDVELKGGQQFEVIVNGVQMESKAAVEAKGTELGVERADENEGELEQEESLDEEEEDEEEAGDSEGDEDAEPGAKLLSEKFEQNLDTRTVKFTGKFKLVHTDKIFLKLIVGGRIDAQRIREMGAKLVPASFNICVEKILAHGRKYGIIPNCIGFTLRSPHIRGGVYSEPMKPNVNLSELLGRILDVACADPLALEGDPYTMIITGQEREDINEDPAPQLLDEHFELNTNDRSVIYTAKFMVDADFDKVFAGYTGSTEYGVMLNILLKIFPRCFHECLQKMFDHGLRHAIKPTHLGFILQSEKIPGGEICEPVKPRTDLGELVRRILERMDRMDVDLLGAPFTVIATGMQP